MKYQELDEAGILQINYDGPPLDTYSLAVMHLNLQEIYDRIAWGTLEEGFCRPDSPLHFWRQVPRGRWLPDQRLVRAEIRELKIGSLLETAAFYIPAFLANPDVRAILQNLAANVVYEIGATRLRAIRKVNREAAPPVKSRIPPIFDVHGNLREIVQTLAENGGGRLRFTHKSPTGEVSTVEMEVASDEHDE